MRRTFSGKTFLGIIVLLFLGLCGYAGNADAGPDTGEVSKKARLVKVSKINASPPRGNIEYVGVLTANRKVRVASENGGTIEQLFFDKGDNVKQGQVLAEISTSSIQLEVRMGNAALEEAKAASPEAENNYKRIKDLYKIRAVSDSKFDSAKRSAEMSRANVQKAEAALALAEDRLRKSRLRSPCSGIIAFREVEEGEVIPPGTTITQVIDLRRLKIKASVNEKDIRLLKKNREFAFTVDAIPDETFSCQLSFLSPTADPVTRSFPVEFLVRSYDQHMADGMTARVKLPVSKEKKSIKVPSAWLSEENGKIGVYVVRDGKAIFRQVTLGAYYDQRVEVLFGLNDDELVITTPAGLNSGDPVKY